MKQKRVGDACQALRRLAIAGDDGLFTEVAAGHDERGKRVAEKQMMQRRVRKHHAERVVAGRERLLKSGRRDVAAE